VFIGRLLELPDELVLTGVLFVVIGHIWPITLSFCGGKGISSFLGGMIAFDPIVTLVIIIGFLIAFPFLRGFTKAGLLSFTLLPVYLYLAAYSFSSILVVIIAIGLVLFAHRTNIKERL